MESFEPSFRRGSNGRLLLTDTAEVMAIKNQHRERDLALPRPAAAIRNEAIEMVKKAGGDVGNSKHLLGCFKMQFGCFREMSFKWILENSPGYAGYLVAAMEKDQEQPTDNRWINKMALKKYVELWPEGKELVDIKKKQISAPKKQVKAEGESSASQTATQEMTDMELFLATEEMEKRIPTGHQKVKGEIKPTLSSRELFVPTVSAQRKALLAGALPASTIQRPFATSDLQCTTATQSVDTQSIVQMPTGTCSQQANEDLCLPARWKTTLRKVDQQWISKALFRRNNAGGVELVPEHLNQLWWYPPQPAVAVNNIPGVDRYFARPLFLWMPRKQWKVRLYCPQPGCEKRELASAGINQKVRQVTDIDGFYNMACDNLECTKCKHRVLSWSHAILSQLDIGHRAQFPCILTAKLACDMKVVRLLRNRGLGNSCSQIRKKIVEQHEERWLQNVLHYLTDCSGFSGAAKSSLLVSPSFSEPPEIAPVPRHRWLMQIYIQDVLHRLDEMKACITSVFGRIIKIDSTKKVVKKLAGRPTKTALWCTNVGNEHGQILTSVMTSGEGHGLTPMLVGVINRYTQAQIPSPEIIYVDRECCGNSPLQQVLTASSWNSKIRLDIWHYMRRIAAGCTTDSHQLYSNFMGLLSNCIFYWDEQDLSHLVKSKRNELAAQNLYIKCDVDIIKQLSRYELALHCRRKTRGVTETTQLINQLIETFSGERGRDTLGVPLINISRMTNIWEAQKKHIACIQDPDGISLYTRTGYTKKGGVELPNFRCARGSTSLECFHLHLNRFIPGTLASDVLFQAYLVDGLHRWNEDRKRAATSTATDLQSYSGLLLHSANVLGMKVLNRKVAPTYQEPGKYTGELIGIEYLYSQTGKVMEDYMKAIQTLETTPEEEIIQTEEDDELVLDTDQIDDLTVSNVGLKESSDISLQVTQEVELPDSSVSTEIYAETSILKIPTSEEYEAMMRDIIGTQAVEFMDPTPAPAVQEGSTGEAHREEIDSELEKDDSVGPDSIPGYGRVHELAAYLVGLRHEIYLTNAQVTHLIQLWNDLSDYDKSPTVFPERFSKESRGRYKAKKSVRNVVPGVESTERSMRGGPGAVPASWPSANRYTEAIFIQLFSVLPRNRTKFDNVTRAYYNIRQLVLQNGRVTSETNIQLPEISRGTLTQWYTKRGKALDKLVVSQGVRFFKPSQTTSQGIPVAVDKPAKLPTGRTQTHTFPCPSNTAGLARFKGQKKTTSRHLKVGATETTRAHFTDTEAPKSACPSTTLKATSTFTASQSTTSFTAVPSICIPLSTSCHTVPQPIYPMAVEQSAPSFTAHQLTYPMSASWLTSLATSHSSCTLTTSQSSNQIIVPQPISAITVCQLSCALTVVSSTYTLPALMSTSVSALRPTYLSISPKSTYHLPPSRSTYLDAAPKSSYHPIAPKQAFSITASDLTSPVAVSMSTHLVTAPQLNYSLVASQSIQTPSTSHPSYPFISPHLSVSVPSALGTCHVAAQQSTPAGPAQQSTIPIGDKATYPLQFLTIDTGTQSHQLTHASQAHAMPVPGIAQSDVPYTTQRYRKRKLEKSKEGVFQRKYVKKKTPTCKHCGQDLKPPIHSQYFMNWFCRATATVSFEQWKEEMTKKGYGKKLKH